MDESKSLRRYQITLQDTGETYLCSENQHVLEGMLSLGKKGIPSGCHGGGCGVCKIQIHSPAASYKTLVMSRAHISDEEQNQGMVLACRTFPLANITLNVVGGIKKNVMRSRRNFVFNFKSEAEIETSNQ